MVFLLFTCPDAVVDENKVATLLKMQKEQVANQWRNPHYCYSHLVAQVNTCGNQYFDSLTPSDVDKVDAQAASHWYRKCFRNPAAFTMVICGNFQKETLEDLAQQYLAAIPRPPSTTPPSTTPSSTTDSHGLPPLPDERNGIAKIDIKFPSSRVARTLTKSMVDPLCCTQMTFPLRIEASDMELRDSMLLGHAVQVLETRLVEKMRFELGAIYNVSASVDFSAAHAAEEEAITGTAAIAWTCQPAYVSLLAQVVLRELKALQSDGPTQKEVDTRAEIARREHETSVKYNSWWVDKLVTSFTVRCFKGDVAASFQHMDKIRKEVLEDIQRSPRVMQEVFATHFTNVDHHTLVTLQPSFFTTLASAFKVHAEAILGNRMHVSTTAAVTAVTLGGSALAVLLILGLRLRRR
jgi:predicted Zn-dependent peptidase